MMNSGKGKVGFSEVMAARSDVSSQSGENGVIEFVARTLGCEKRTCVEFGAWDGVYLSNVYPLWHDHGWSALLVEQDARKMASLLGNTAGYDVSALRAFVEEEGSNSLVALMKHAEFGDSAEVLSIDIDGNDYAVLESLNLRDLGVRLVVVEFNDSMPPHFEYVRRGANYTGSSALAFVKMMRKKKYELLCTCGTNLFFVSESDFAEHFGYENDLNRIFDFSNISYLMSDYAGNLMCDKLPNQTPVGYGALYALRRLARWLKHPRTRRDPRNGVSVRGVQVLKPTSKEERTKHV